MSVRKAWLMSAAGLLLLLLLCPLAVAQETPPPPAEPATVPAAEEVPVAEEVVAVPACSDCHDQAKTFLTNPHARGAVTKGVVSNDVRTACHGDGAEHIEGGGDKSKISVPHGRTGSDETCMLCHDTANNRMTRRGIHANTENVNCLTCHSIHSPDRRSPHLVTRPQLALCGSCHTQAASMRNKPYAHSLDRGGMTCSSCHEPHGRPAKGERSLAMTGHLRTTRAGEAPCLSCHTEKRGSDSPPSRAHAAGAAGTVRRLRAQCRAVRGECACRMNAAFDPRPPLRVLLAHDVRFVIIGGIAGVLLGSPLSHSISTSATSAARRISKRWQTPPADNDPPP
jgi:DmsE family decaheme c-type cytochrome